MACQLGPGLPRPPLPITLVPFISQMTVSPLLVLPQDVGEPVAVEIAGADRMPARPGIAEAAAADHRVPFSSQMTTSPLSFCHRCRTGRRR